MCVCVSMGMHVCDMVLCGGQRSEDNFEVSTPLLPLDGFSGSSLPLPSEPYHQPKIFLVFLYSRYNLHSIKYTI